VVATSWNDPFALATVVLAVATAWMAWSTRAVAMRTREAASATVELAKLTEESLATSVRPLLADVPQTQETDRDAGVFPAPGRNGYDLRGDDAYVSETQCSTPLRNVGSGVAVITGAWTEPPFATEVEVTAKLLAPGGRLRVNVSTMGTSEERRLLGGGFTVAVAYSDARGVQSFVTRVLVGTYATSSAAVRGVSITQAGEDKPFVTSGHMEFP